MREGGAPKAAVMVGLALTPVAAWLSMSALGYVAIAGVAALLAVRALRLTALEIVVILAPVMFYAPFAGGQMNISVADFLMPLSAVTVVLNSRKRRLGPPPKFLVAHISAVIFSLVLSLTVAVGAGRLFSLSAGLISISKWLIVLVYLIVVFIEARAAVSMGDYRFLKIWSYTALSIAAMSALTAFNIVPLTRQFGESGRYSGTFEDPNLFGAYLLVSLTIVPAARVKAGLRFASLHYVVLGLAALMTASRATYGGLVLLVALTVILGNGVAQRLRAFAAMVGAAVLGYAFWASSGTDVVHLALERVLERGAVASSDIRITFWELAWAKWQEYPLTGLGPGQYLYASGSIFSTVTGGVAHNTYLEILSELGLVGALAFAILGCSVAWFAFRYRATFGPLSTLALVGMGGIALEMGSLSLQNARFIWVFFGILAALLSRGQQPAELIVENGVRQDA